MTSRHRLSHRLVAAVGMVSLAAILTIVGWTDKPSSVVAQATATDFATSAREDFNAKIQSQPTASATGVVSIQGATPNTAPYPHMALYGGPNSSGWPMVGTLADSRPAPGTPLNEDVMNAYARFPHLILPTSPLADTRTDILTSLRARNAAVRIHAYVMGSTTWCPTDANGNIAYPAGMYYRDYYLAVTGGDPSCASTSDRFLWMQDGIKADLPPHSMGINVNLAHRVQNPDLSYQYDVAEAIATAMYTYAKASRNWDGIFIDVFCPGILWMEPYDPSPTPTYTGSDYFDYGRAGFTTGTNAQRRTAFDIAWQAGHQRLAEKLRELAVADGHPDYPISGNCGQAPARLHAPMNGWMRENYPFQNGGNFYTNMLTWPWGFLYQDQNFRAPQYNYIFTAANWSGGMTNNPNDEQYNTLNQRKMRYGLGSAALGNGWAAFHHSSGNPADGYWFNWWYDEYGVNTRVPRSDPNWGKSMNGAAYTGWLGEPKGDMYQMVYPNFAANPDLLNTNQGFETAGATASDIPGWTFVHYNPAVGSISRDTSSQAVESASVKIQIDQASDPYTYAIGIHPTATIPVLAYQQYAVTFWAKASADRNIDVNLWNGGSLQQVSTLQIHAGWQQYQVILKPTSGFNATFSFDLGRSVGAVWLDDVHVQAGVSSIFRRDFTYGTVLVNPTDGVQTVQLERPMRKILGSVNPILNDGSQVTSVTLAGTTSAGGIGDALFLLDVDVSAPSPVLDLRTR